MSVEDTVGERMVAARKQWMVCNDSENNADGDAAFNEYAAAAEYLLAIPAISPKASAYQLLAALNTIENISCLKYSEDEIEQEMEKVGKVIKGAYRNLCEVAGIEIPDGDYGWSFNRHFPNLEKGRAA